MKLSLMTYEQATAELTQRAQLAMHPGTGYACFCNVHMTVEAFDNQQLRKATDQATYVFTDGKPLCWGLSLLSGVSQERIAGMDMMPTMLAEAERLKLPVYFLGGSVKTNEAVVQKAVANHPALVVAGAESPPFRPLAHDEEADLLDRINRSGAKLLFVALGCPKQEIWMNRLSPKLVPLCLGVGGAFPVYAGLEARAPKWAQKIGMEWFYRLLQDPKRLFKRYLLTNTRFVYQLFAQFLANCIGKKEQNTTN